ncbi:PKD domain-containing protein [Tenacibaculum discolor]|uniref:PKD domain-containing protein n=1 Tax=Tenacibaculum discolor TaxID=361581 RepID=A0A2G1BRC7_9FLAO|nr:PKD domain-containing protein [Tenacibaculum discolor]MDP2542096.1 PKD domain-containing protein [Tenacibaculum discolor]PHN96600.1 PKD domain-containing protein [Tenacibaculum discolor]PHN99524.1 PKD domain-containing protein [Rhodobacteraceae bacterium 4F10]
MRKVLFFIIILLGLYACVNEVALPVTVDFSTEIVNQDYTVPVKVKITNDTEGADTYNWTFEGGEPNSSSSRNPGVITYNTEGEYLITLEASNRDGSVDVKTQKVTVKPTVLTNFDVEVLENNYSPVEVKITNKTVGATTFEWFFEGGNPETSTEEHPQNVIFTTSGEHTIRLKVSNGEEIYTQEKKIEVAPYLVANFDYDVAFEDDDYQVPVKVTLTNKSVSSTSYDWTFEGANITNSSAVNPEIEIQTPGTHTLQLKASNGKQEKVFSKTITVYENTNLRSLENVKLGINTAHKENAIGAFFSTKTRKVYTKSEVTNETGKDIDLVFFGLNESFSYNKFVSPDQASTVAFSSIPNAQTTQLINKQESCSCSTSLSVTDFNSMTNDELLVGLTIDETNEGLKEFNDTITPRIIPFKISDNRKGAIKIKQFVKDGTNSYIVVDIKVQKEAK